ncbi:hypothetical protein BGZ60DRAFT_528346 [Tricladium varicosporioides]|nr:hypothetical protein BGZ60DRAFT_528346 [Hymenoscyphus varicosporioides]
MTRLYTKDFRCASCARVGSFGWLYRCTQDRELLLEDDYEQGHVQNFDNLCEIFDRPNIPLKRSPAARLSKLSVLQEINDEQLKSYSSEQLAQVLKQRAHLQDILNDITSQEDEAENFYTPSSYKAANRNSIPAAIPPNQDHRTDKPWLPLRGGECQFKCCHRCRPALADRSFLSLNAVVNNDVPLTAITGFGFHLQKSRPIGPKDVVENIGLRSQTTTAPVNPRSHSADSLTVPHYIAHLLVSPHPTHTPPTSSQGTPSTESSLGLGIFATATTFVNENQLPRSRSKRSSVNSTYTTASVNLANLPPQQDPAEFEAKPLPPLPLSALGDKRGSLKAGKRLPAPPKLTFPASAPRPVPASTDSTSLTSLLINAHLPTVSTPSATSSTMILSPLHASSQILQNTAGILAELPARRTPSPQLTPILTMTPILTLACRIPFPGNTSLSLGINGDGGNRGEEEEIVTRPLTPMEKTEFEEGIFGGEPLDVGDGGVAVMEEAVGGHWADVVTQL